MTNADIFKSDIMSFPIERNTDNFFAFQKKVFSDYNETLDSFTGKMAQSIIPIRPLINSLCDGIILSLEAYLNGDTIKAYNLLANTLEQVEPMLEKRKGVVKSKVIKDPEEFYRARIGNGKLYARNEMFHIPFEKRHLVSSQRYSLPGVPCLYLSNSTYLCWEELGKPDFDKLQFSRFDLSESDLNFLDLNVTNQALWFLGFDKDGELIEKMFYLLMRFLITWPLRAAVSNILKIKDASFKPEYVIPQLLLQWVVNNETFDGIRFFSTKSTGIVPIIHYGNMANLVIPIKKGSESGICEELKNKIPLTSPISYEYASIINPQLVNEKIEEENINVNMKPLYLRFHEDFTPHYSNTKFGQLEVLLSKSKAKIIE